MEGSSNSREQMRGGRKRVEMERRVQEGEKE